VLRRIPSAKAEIKAAHKGNRLVDDAELFVLQVSGCQGDEQLELLAVD
jgi:hypothetical protein